MIKTIRPNLREANFYSSQVSNSSGKSDQIVVVIVPIRGGHLGSFNNAEEIAKAISGDDEIVEDSIQHQHGIIAWQLRNPKNISVKKGDRTVKFSLEDAERCKSIDKDPFFAEDKRYSITVELGADGEFGPFNNARRLIEFLSGEKNRTWAKEAIDNTISWQVGDPDLARVSFKDGKARLSVEEVKQLLEESLEKSKEGWEAYKLRRRQEATKAKPLERGSSGRRSVIPKPSSKIEGSKPGNKS